MERLFRICRGPSDVAGSFLITGFCGLSSPENVRYSARTAIYRENLNAGATTYGLISLSGPSGGVVAGLAVASLTNFFPQRCAWRNG